MSQILSELRYTKTHEWVRLEDDGTLTIGISDHAQSLLGDIVYVELPELETGVNAGDDAGVIESVKAASDVYAPVSGEVIAVNETLNESPDLINSDPYGAGWLFRIQPQDEGEVNELLDADSYEEVVESEDH